MESIYSKKDLCYNPNLSVHLSVTDLEVFVNAMGETKPTRKQKDHERYMRNRKERLRRQREYYAQHREYFQEYYRKKHAEATEKLLMK
jgi:hypothetical protein